MGTITNTTYKLHDLAEHIHTTLATMRSADSREVLVYLICIECENPDAFPPQVAVVFKEDADYFLQHRDSIEDGADALFIPTLQEDYDFPMAARYPFLEIQGDLDPNEPLTDQEAFARAMVALLNSWRTPTNAPFLLVDLEGECERYSGDLDATTRSELSAFFSP